MAIYLTYFRWASSLKFQIVAMAVVTCVLSAVLTTRSVLSSMEGDVQHVLVQGDSAEVVRTAALLASKLSMLKDSLAAEAAQLDADLWVHQDVLSRTIVEKAALNVLFDNLLAVKTDGDVYVRVTRGKRTDYAANIAERPYFQQALKSTQPVVSQPLVSKITRLPVIVIAVAAPGHDGTVAGVVIGSLALQSTSLFSDVTRAAREDGSRSMIINRAGTVLAHPDPARVLGRAGDEPGLADVLARWQAAGTTQASTGETTVSQGHLVSRAEIPGSDWAVVRITPQAVALQPIVAAQATAWKTTVAVGLLVAALAGELAWLLTRSISRLRARAEQMLSDDARGKISGDGWPQGHGEVGDLAHAFRQVLADRQSKQGETQALLLQIQAVLEHAEVGIALTRNGLFELVSPHFCHIFRCTEAQTIGQPTRIIYPSDEASRAFSVRAHPLFLAHGAFDGEIELIRRNGELFWAHMRGRAVLTGDRTKGTVWTVEDVTEAREHRERLAWASTHDSLTGLANRPAFEAMLERAVARADTDPFCAMFIDLDQFKRVNDTGGHAAGDALLRDIARVLDSQVRVSDTVARIGGDEFAVLLGRCPQAQALEIAEKLRKSVVDYRLAWEGQSFGVGASIGLVFVDLHFGRYTGSTATDVLRAADAACYAAKQRGRNCVVRYDPQTMVGLEGSTA